MQTFLKNKNSVLKDGRYGGFTLIELLVVIAIIAILAAILLPVLAHAKLKATEAYSLNDDKQMAAGWLMYADDNKENLMTEYTPTGASIFAPYSQAGGFWGINRSLPPVTAGSQGTAMSIVLGDLQTNNLFGLYIQNPQVFHCPGDVRFNDLVTQGWAYDSFAVSENVESAGTAVNKDNNSFTTMAAIKRPANCINIVEQADTRGYNEGTFAISVTAPNKVALEDVFSMYHGNVGTFAFADGHADYHTWHNQDIIYDGKYSVNQGPAQGYDYNTCPYTSSQCQNVPGPLNDMAWIIQNFESKMNP